MTETPGSPFEAERGRPGIDAGPSKGTSFLGDRYRVLEVRRGGMGEVFICTPADDEELELALKSFQKRLFFDRSSRDAFVREVAVWTRLTGQPHIMPALGLEYFDDRPFVLFTGSSAVQLPLPRQ